MEAHESQDGLDDQITQARGAGDGVLEQRQAVTFQQQRAHALGGGREPQPALGGVIKGGRGEPDALALFVVEQQRVGEPCGVRRHQHEQRIARVIAGQIFFDKAGQHLEGFLYGEAAVDDYIPGLFADGGKAWMALRVAIPKPVGEKALVIDAVRG